MQGVLKLIAAGLAAVAFNAQAQIVTSAFDGGWYDPEHAGQGFIFEQVTTPQGKQELLVYFSTFDIDGAPTLLVGQAPISGRVVEMVLNRPVITGLGQAGFLPNPVLIPSGTLRLEMDNCSVGKAHFVVQPRPGAVPASLSKIRVGTGSLNLMRLNASTAAAKRCTGGISDNTSPVERPERFEKFYVGAFVDARVFYEKRTDRSELLFDLRNLPIGNYAIEIDGVGVSTVDSLPFRSGTRATIKFSSPVVDGARLLDFDPVDRIIKVRQSVNSAISDQFRTPQRTEILDTQPDFVGVVVGNTAVTGQTFDNTQVGGFGVRGQENFLLEAELVESATAVELTLNVENADPGYYDVLISGKRRGTVYVLPRQGGVTYGRAVFRKPVEAGAFALDFDPRGAEVLFLRGSNLEFNAIILQGN